MSCELYIERNFRGPSSVMIEQANAIIEEYQAAGFRLTLRQLYYQFVARDLIANTKENYDLLGRTMVYARDAGQSDWDAMEDRTERFGPTPRGQARLTFWKASSTSTRRTCGKIKNSARKFGSRRTR